MPIARTTVACAMDVASQLQENLNIKLQESFEITENF